MVFHLARRGHGLRSLTAAAFLVAVVAGAIPACAATAGDPAVGGVNVRILVKLTRPSGDPAAIAAEASIQAGVAVKYAASVSAAWHALVLHCSDAAECDLAITRLQQASGSYEAVERDGRKQRL